MLRLIAILFTCLLCHSAHCQEDAAQKYEVEKVLYSKEFSSNRRKFTLKLHLKYPHAQTLLVGGKEWNVRGVLLLLQKSPVDLDAKEDPTETVTIWRTLSDQPLYEAVKMGDAYIDETTQKVYQVLTSGLAFGVQVIDLNLQVPNSSSNVYGRVSPLDGAALAEERRRRIATPDELQWSPVRIDAIKIDKQGDELLVTIGAGENPKQIWSLSLQERVWKKLFDVRDEEKAARDRETKATQATVPPLQTVGDIPQQEVLLWKRPAIEKAEGEGLVVKREKLVPKVPESFEAVAPHGMNALPRYSYLYTAADHQWREAGKDTGWMSFHDLWSLRLDAFGEQAPPELKVFDALHEPQGERRDQPGVFVVLYRQGDELYAVVTRPDERGVRRTMTLQNARLLNNLAPEPVQSAKITGSPLVGTLQVEVRWNDTVKTWRLEQKGEQPTWKLTGAEAP